MLVFLSVYWICFDVSYETFKAMNYGSLLSKSIIISGKMAFYCTSCNMEEDFSEFVNIFLSTVR